MTEPLDEASPEELAADDEKRQQARNVIKSYVDAGWQPNPDKPGELVHPQDSERSIWCNPYTHTIFLSQKEAEIVKDTIRQAFTKQGPSEGHSR